MNLKENLVKEFQGVKIYTQKVLNIPSLVDDLKLKKSKTNFHHIKYLMLAQEFSHT